LIDPYEAWNKPEKAEQWQIRLPQTVLRKESTGQYNLRVNISPFVSIMGLIYSLATRFLGIGEKGVF